MRIVDILLGVKSWRGWWGVQSGLSGLAGFWLLAFGKVKVPSSPRKDAEALVRALGQEEEPARRVLL